MNEATPEDLAEFGIVEYSASERGAKDDCLPLSSDVNDVDTEYSTYEEAGQSAGDLYAGDAKDDSPPLRGKYEALNFDDPTDLLYFYDPVFNSGRVHLHDWQIDVSEDFVILLPTAQYPYKLALCAANGSGKDAFVVAPFVIWFALTKIRSLSVITSASGVQLTAQTENYIRSLAEKVNDFHGQPMFKINRRFIKCLLTGSEIRLFATDEAGKAEGYHPLDPDAEMAIIVNEAKNVGEDIIGALRRCTGYNYWLYVSTPGEPRGSFYKACSDGIAKQSRWHFRRITAYDCPHLSLDEIESDKRDLGEHSALFRSMRLAQFTAVGGTVVVKQDVVNKWTTNPPARQFTHWPMRIGIDYSAGRDETVIVCWHGNKRIAQICFYEEDTTITADRLEKILANDWKIPKSHNFIFADDGNVGHSITDMLRRKGWNITRIVNQWPARNKREFGNLGAELWYRFNRFIEEGFIILPTDDEKFMTQLTTRKYSSTNMSRIYLQSKKDAKLEGLSSPDRADATVLAFTGVSLDDFMSDKGEVLKDDSENPASVVSVYDLVQQQKWKQFRSTSLKNAKVANGSLDIALQHNN
jgi:hypothetical protein